MFVHMFSVSHNLRVMPRNVGFSLFVSIRTHRPSGYEFPIESSTVDTNTRLHVYQVVEFL